MSPTSPFPAIAALTVALSAAFFLVNRVGAPSIAGRFITIDGLRGYLAFFVFLHHASIWYFFLHTGYWNLPPSNLYVHFGQSSLTLFFMITGFLFWTKLIDGRYKKINWLRLYISRIMRLTPLYFFMLFLLMFLIAVLSNFVLNEPTYILIKKIIQWSTFRILGAPDLNGMTGTSIVIAGVTWSLPYEWLFYLSLPISAVFIRVIPPYLYLLISATCVAAFVTWNTALPNLAAFGGCIAGGFASGIAAAFLVRWNLFSSLVNGKLGAIIALLCVGITISVFRTAFTPPALFLLAVAFTIVACGNTLFGVLSNPIARALGETSYSIYLLHSIILFVTFKFVVGFDNAAMLSPVEHWLIVLCCTVVLVPVCFATFHFIEAPAMRTAPRISAWIEIHLPKRSKGCCADTASSSGG